MAKFEFLALLLQWFESMQELEFEWDHGNKVKSAIKHEITCEEAESLFHMKDFLILLGKQVRPPVPEDRYGAYGVTNTGRHLFVCFTIRGKKIRVISIRKMNRKDLKEYEKLR
ncbi:MAG: BrnT family toxin [Bdellovibrionota bacterium]